MKLKKAKWLSGEALQKAEERKEEKVKKEKESYIYLNAKFKRISRSIMKAFLLDQQREIKRKINRGGKKTEWERLETS